jgi:hypothetical protein
MDTIIDALKLARKAFANELAFQQDNRAQSNLVGLFIGLMIATIVAVQVFIPVVNDAIASSNVSGTEKTILELLSLFAALLLLIALASPLMRRV